MEFWISACTNKVRSSVNVIQSWLHCISYSWTFFEQYLLLAALKILLSMKKALTIHEQNLTYETSYTEVSQRPHANRENVSLELYAHNKLFHWIPLSLYQTFKTHLVSFSEGASLLVMLESSDSRELKLLWLLDSRCFFSSHCAFTSCAAFSFKS